MEWSLLPARSAPTGVSVDLSCSACAPDTAAKAGAAAARHARPRAAITEMTCRIRGYSSTFGKMPGSCMFASTSEIERWHRGTRLERTAPAVGRGCRSGWRVLAGSLMLACAVTPFAAWGADLFQDDGW